MPKGLIAYELLGVLLPPLPELTVAWRDMDAKQRKAYRERLLEFVNGAEPIYRPEGQFAVITGMREWDKMAQAVLTWLNDNFKGQWKSFALLDKPRTHDNLLIFKAAWIERLGVTEYWEPDPSLVRELTRACPNTRIRWAASLMLEKSSVKIT